MTGSSTVAPDWRALGFHPDLSMAQAFARNAEAAPGRKIVFWSKERVDATTLGDMHAEALKIAAGLQALGLGQGDVIGLQVANNLEGALAFQAIFLLGAVVLPIVHNYGPAEVSWVLRQSGARAFIVPARMGKIDYLAHLETFSDLPDLLRVVVIGDSAPPGAVLWKDLTAGAPPALRPVTTQPDDLALILYTSGTTAAPKGVQHSHNSLLAEAYSTMVWDDGLQTTLSPWPAGHAAGTFVLIRAHTGGIPTVFMERWDAEAAAGLIAEWRITASAGAPVMLTDLLELADAGRADLSSLKRYQCGTSSVSPALMERAERYGLRPFRSYGCSEHPTISRGHVDDPLHKRMGTDGKLTPGTQVRILDEQDCDLAVGLEGEIVSRGPETFLGYRDSSLNAAAFLPGGWYRTGDIGRLDAEGHLTITDRKKDIIIRGGENISSKEVEDLLLRHPAILEAAVVAAPHPRLGEIAHAFVVPRGGAIVDLDLIRDHFLKAGVARHKTPEGLSIMQALPRTAAGKIKKFQLRDGLRRPVVSPTPEISKA